MYSTQDQYVNIVGIKRLHNAANSTLFADYNSKLRASAAAVVVLRICPFE